MLRLDVTVERAATLVVALALALVAAPTLALATTTTAPAPPPEPPGVRTHDGSYFRIGGWLGRMWLDYDAPMNTDERHAGSATGPDTGLDVALGWTLPGGLVLGGTLFGHFERQLDFENPEVTSGWDTAKTGLIGLGAFARFYPMPRRGLHVEAIAAGVRHRTTHERRIVHVPWACPILIVPCLGIETETIEAIETSYGYELALGAGYEFWIGRQWSFGPTGRMRVAHAWRGERSYWFFMPNLALGFTHH